MGHGQKGGCLILCHSAHDCREAGAKPFIDDLLVGQGFIRSRAASLLRSVGSHPSTHTHKKKLPLSSFAYYPVVQFV